MTRSIADVFGDKSERVLRRHYIVCLKRMDDARTIGWPALEASWRKDLIATLEAMAAIGMTPPRTGYEGYVSTELSRQVVEYLRAQPRALLRPEAIAAGCGSHTRPTISVLSALVTKGWVELVREPVAKSGRPANHYRLMKEAA